MVQTFRPAFLTLALLVGAAPAFAQGGAPGSVPASAQGVSTTMPAPASNGTQRPVDRPVAAVPATPANPAGQASTQRPATAQAPARPAQPSGTAATTPAPTAPRTN